MFLLNGQPLSPDNPFTTQDGTQYPANWLRLATSQERDAIGITEAPDPSHYDDRFYWSVGNPKDVEQVRKMLRDQIKATAFSMLLPTDWMFTRKDERGIAVDADTLAARAAIHSACTNFLAAVASATTTDQLAALQLVWPQTEPT